MKRIAILRPEPGASRTLARAQRLGLDAHVVPLFALEAIDWSVPDPGAFDALLLTSANAARLAGPQLSRLAHLPVHAVGPATAAAALEAGLTVASCGTGNAADLRATLNPSQRLLHLAGEERMDAGPATEAISVYRARAIDCPPGFKQIQGQVALVHSPRAARRIGELADGLEISRAQIAIAAISAQAAAAAGRGWARIEAAPAPLDDALLALAAELCKMVGEP
ncbi:MAG: uroporphyrinogen-III synthase [Sphingomicrobium sp.]